MAKDNDFSRDIDAFAINFLDATEETVRVVAAQTWEAIVIGWPVDEGRSRANWFATSTRPSTKTTEKTDESGSSTATAAINKALKSNDWSNFYLTNNLAYSPVIEFGGYPDPVKLGTRQKDGSYKQLSSGGYSKQAPSGVMRINMNKSKALLEQQGKIRLSKL